MKQTDLKLIKMGKLKQTYCKTSYTVGFMCVCCLMQMCDTSKEIRSRMSVMLQSQQSVCYQFTLTDNTFSFITSSLGRVRSIAMRMSVRSHNSNTTMAELRLPIPTLCMLSVAVARSSSGGCYTLCASSFVDGVVFSQNGPVRTWIVIVYS